MASLRASHARSRRGAEWLRVKIRRRFAPKLRANGKRRRLRIVLAEAGFIVLVVSTIWMITSVSVWWVPVYVALLITIFTVPRRGRLLSTASETDAIGGVVGLADLEPGLRVDSAEGADQLRLLSRSDSYRTEDQWTESSSSKPDPTTGRVPKSRRNRVQVRKSVPANERATGPATVVWIQAGPGKFIRVEGGLQAANSAEIAGDSRRNYPATDMTAEVIEAVPTQAELPAEETRLESVGATPTGTDQFGNSENRDSDSITAEYGIAPSALGLTPTVDTGNTRAEGELPSRAREFGGIGSRHYLPQQGLVRGWVFRASCVLAHAMPKTSRGLQRRVIRAAPNPRSLVESCFAANIRRRHTASLALGRMRHTRCNLRTRSPPCSRGRRGLKSGAESRARFVERDIAAAEFGPYLSYQFSDNEVKEPASHRRS
jgi:hypothetical protein